MRLLARSLQIIDFVQESNEYLERKIFHEGILQKMFYREGFCKKCIDLQESYNDCFILQDSFKKYVFGPILQNSCKICIFSQLGFIDRILVWWISGFIEVYSMDWKSIALHSPLEYFPPRQKMSWIDTISDQDISTNFWQSSQNFARISRSWKDIKCYARFWQEIQDHTRLSKILAMKLRRQAPQCFIHSRAYRNLSSTTFSANFSPFCTGTSPDVLLKKVAKLLNNICLAAYFLWLITKFSTSCNEIENEIAGTGTNKFVWFNRDQIGLFRTMMLEEQVNELKRSHEEEMGRLKQIHREEKQQLERDCRDKLEQSRQQLDNSL